MATDETEAVAATDGKLGGGKACKAWMARVLKARGLTEQTPPSEQARVYSRFMKRLRAKACKLRRRLEESAQPEMPSEALSTPGKCGSNSMLLKCSELYEVCCLQCIDMC